IRICWGSPSESNSSSGPSNISRNRIASGSRRAVRSSMRIEMPTPESTGMQHTENRRSFLRYATGFCAAAAAGRAVLAQTSCTVRPVRDDENAFIADRKPFAWPGGKTLAVWIIPNVEVFVLNRPGEATPAVAGDTNVVDFTWREYGMRVGLWRIADVLQ